MYDHDENNDDFTLGDEIALAIITLVVLALLFGALIGMGSR